MKSTLATLILAALPAAASAEVVVAATVPDLAAIAKAVVGDRGRVFSLTLHTQDPHWVDARPSLALDLARADVLLAVGLELEIGWLPNLQLGARNPAIKVGGPGYLEVATLVNRLEIPAGKIDRSMGDVHPGGNPHFLYDPRRAIPIARGIAERLAAIDGAGAATYRANAEKLAAQLDGQISGWQQRLAPLRGAKVIGYHRSLPYLADWLGLEVAGHVEPKPGIPPNPAHVAHLLGRIKADGIGLVLQEQHHPRTTAQILADKGGAKLVVFEGGTRFADGETIVQRFERWVTALEAARR